MHLDKNSDVSKEIETLLNSVMLAVVDYFEEDKK